LRRLCVRTRAQELIAEEMSSREIHKEMHKTPRAAAHRQDRAVGRPQSPKESLYLGVR